MKQGVLFLSILLMAGVIASADVITFEGLDGTPTYVGLYGEPAPQFAWGNFWDYTYAVTPFSSTAGNNILISNGAYGSPGTSSFTVEFTGNHFDFIGAEFGTIQSGGLNLLVSDGTTSTTIALTNQMQYFGFSMFNDVSFLTFTPVGNGYFFMDNFEYGDAQLPSNPVPAPAAVALSGIGVSLVGWLRRRKSL